MIDLKKLANKSPVITWTGFIFTILMAINGLTNIVVDNYSKLSSLIEDDSLIAVIGYVDLQFDKYDLVEVDFRNPTKSTKTISDVSLLCKTSTDSSLRIFAANNAPKEWSVFRNIELMPISIEPGRARKVKLIFSKEKSIGYSLRACASIMPTWTGNTFNVQHGDRVEIPDGAVTFTNTTLNRNQLSATM